MASLQIGKYKRPGIFVEEYDQSVIASQTVQGIVNTVIGVSRTGPINTPVLISNTTDLQNIFGNIDRNLERKGSFFHRTIAQMIQSSPVWAINLLATDDTLDTIQYAPLSVSTDKTNDVIKTGPYRRFFNNTGFWKRDADSFLTLASNNANYGDRLLNLTNMSSNFITVFVFKSTVTGFDRTMIDWYGSVEQIPPYVYPTDYVSDYMVDVVVLAGDWSNYQALSVDVKWSKYFDSTGLLKAQVSNFTNDVNVTLLKYYQGLSFLPYFKDNSNKNIFIETVINKDTDKTGLFCAFNMDAFDTDYPNGKVDLIGNNLVNTDSLIDSNATSIDFLSYSDTIIENTTFVNTILDRPGNVISLDENNNYRDNDFGGGIGGDLSNISRTNWYAEDIAQGVTRTSSARDTASASVLYTFNDGSLTINGFDSIPYAVIGGNKISLGTASQLLSVNASDYGSYSTAKSYYAAFKLDTTGAISRAISTTVNTYPAVSATDIVLGYMSLTTLNGTITSMTYSDVTVNSSGYNDLKINTDYTLTSLGANNGFELTFLNTAAVADPSNYSQYRRIKRFNAIRNILESTTVGEASLIVSYDDVNSVKQTLATMTVGSIVTSSSLNKSINLSTNLGLTETIFASTVLNNLNATNSSLNDTSECCWLVFDYFCNYLSKQLGIDLTTILSFIINIPLSY